MIYEYFHSTEKYTFRCQNCGEYYDYGTKNIIKINLDNVKKLRDSAFPELANQMLTIEECLQYYAGGHLVSCKYCGNPSIYKYTEFPNAIYYNNFLLLKFHLINSYFHFLQILL